MFSPLYLSDWRLTDKLDDALWNVRPSRESEGGWELQLIAELVGDSRYLVIVRIQFNLIIPPYRQLCLAGIWIPYSLLGIPSPTLVRIERIELLLQLLGSEKMHVTGEVPINVVGVVLTFHKGPINIDVVYTNLKKLIDDDIYDPTEPSTVML